MSEYKIEKNIPLGRHGGGEKARKYPFPDMEIGDSILGEKKVSTAATQWGRKNGRTFKSRAVEGGFRVWRVS